MGRKNKEKKRKRRKCSDDSPSEHFSKNPRNGASPQNEDLCVSDTLRIVNSVLYGENTEKVLNFSETDSDTDSDKDKDKDIMERNSQRASVSAPQAEGVAEQDKGQSSNEVNNADIFAYLKRLDQKLTVVDKKLEKLDSLETKISKFDTELKKLWGYIHDKGEVTDEKLSDLSDKTENVEFALGMANDKLTQLQRENDVLKEEMLYVQSQSMRNNLVFVNIEESVNERDDETQIKLRNFMVEKMKMAQDLVDSIRFERVHRMGRRNANGRTRSIVAKFTLFPERENTRKYSKNLKGTQFFVNEQFPRAIADKRKALYPKMKAEIRKGNRAWISYDTLYVNGIPDKVQREAT